MKLPFTLVVVLCVGTISGSAAASKGVDTGRIFDTLLAERRSAGAPDLERRTELDRVAADRARRIAALPHERRLALPESIDGQLREAGIHWFEQASVHLDMLRGYRHATAAFLRRWREYRQAWSTAMAPRQQAIGLAAQTADDGWVILVAVFLRDLPVPESLPELEHRILDAVNEIRRERRLPELAEDRALTEAARSHSADMARREYFGHRSPEGAEGGDRIREHGADFERWAENVHMSRGETDPARFAVDSWMSSDSHRKAILSPEFRRTGVGVALGEDASIYFTQLFTTPRRLAPADR